MQQSKRSRAEDLADSAARKSKQALPHLARLLLLSPFLENGFRTWTESDRQRDQLDRTLSCGEEVASLLVFVTVLGLSIAPLLIRMRRKIKSASWILGSVLLLQTLAQSSIWDSLYFFRVALLAGSLILLSVDAYSKDRSIYAGIPQLSLKKTASLTQLSGPFVVLLMLLALPETTSCMLKSIQNIISTLLWLCVPGPRRIRLGCLAGVVLISSLLVFYRVLGINPPQEAEVDFSEYKLFPTLCVTGGFLMIVSLGFGDSSIFERRKKLAKTFTGSQNDLRSSLCEGSEFKGFGTKLQNCKRRRSF